MLRRRPGGGRAACRSCTGCCRAAPPAPRARGRRARRPRRARRLRRTRASPRAARVDHRANGFDPTELLRDFDYGKTRRLASGRVAARMGDRRPGQGDRSRARGQVRGLDLQRPGPRPDPARPRGRAAADPLRQRLRTPPHDPLPRHPHGADGRHAGDRRKPRRRRDRARGRVHLRVRRRAVRPAPLPLPRLAARQPHLARALRRLRRSIRSRAARKPTRW